jgi:hypothetical protein
MSEERASSSQGYELDYRKRMTCPKRLHGLTFLYWNHDRRWFNDDLSKELDDQDAV